jgi:hypothetical protein
MDAPSARYIITRAIFLLAALFVILQGISFFKKKQRQTAIITELKSIASDSSYFQQFYAADAQKSLVRAIGLIAEAKQLGIPPEKSIDRSLGIEARSAISETVQEPPTPRQELIRASLRANYENFFKLGYQADFQTLKSMKEGVLPPLPSGPEAGKKPVIAPLIDPSLSAGIDKVIANLEIRPPQVAGRLPSDIEIAAAKLLAKALAEARVIEDSVRDKIIKGLSKTDY